MENKYTTNYYNSTSYKIYYFTGPIAANSYPTNWHYHPDLTITYFKNCSGIIRIEGKQYNINQGDVILLNPDELHNFQINDSPFHERVSIYIKDSILDNFSSSRSLDFRSLYNRKSGVNNLISMEQVKKYKLDLILDSILENAADKEQISEVLVICKIIEFLSLIAKITSPDNSLNILPYYENSTINEVLKFISKNFQNNLSIQDIAEKFFVSKYHLCRLFKKNVGIALWDYVILRRLLYFNDLVEKNVPIEKACYNAGFNNYSNFYRLYKKHMHMTPLEFKKQNFDIIF